MACITVATGHITHVKAHANVMKLIDREPTEEMLFAARFYKEGTHTLACAWRAMYDAAPDIQQEPIGYIDGHYGFVRTKEEGL